MSTEAVTVLMSILGRNLIGDFVRNWQEGLVSDDHVLCPRAHCRKERDTLAFAKPLRRLGVCSDLENRPDALKSRNSQSSFRNRHDRPPLRKGGKNMDITGMDRSSTDLYKDIVNSEVFGFELTFGYC